MDSKRYSLRHTYQEIIGLENLLAAWEEFRLGKRDKPETDTYIKLTRRASYLAHEAS